jgi:SAM-dependent methyltransferase
VRVSLSSTRAYRTIAPRVPVPVKRRIRSTERVARDVLRRGAESLDRAGRPTRSFAELPDRQAIRVAYNTVLLREPDPEGEAHFLERLSVEGLPRERFLELLRGSEEFYYRVRFTDLLNSLHLSRCDFVRSLPRASRILDLGGTHQQNPEGAFVHLGYPYRFERLVVVDLPIEERHEIYQLSQEAKTVESSLGPVEYAYHSMSDLSRYNDESFDLIYSGQTIEHVTESDCDKVLAEVRRVLKPGGWFAVDTPNGRACRLQQEAFINDDHKVEYTHEEFVAKLVTAGLEIREAKGLNYVGRSLQEGVFDIAEAAGNRGVYGEPQDCYLLAYVCTRHDGV